MRCAAMFLVLAACTHPRGGTTPARMLPMPSVQVGSCADPPAGDHADRDLDSDGRPETIVTDRKACSGAGGSQNCRWDVYRTAPGECTRFIGSFDGAWLEVLADKGDDNMSDVRAFWAQPDHRLLLQSYHFVRGGYQIADVLQCKYGSDDRLECADTGR